MDFSKIMEQAKSLKENFEKQQSEFQNKSFVGKSGGGLVTVEVLGSGRVTVVKIDEDTAKSDVKMTEDLVVAAFNNAMEQKDEAAKEMTSDLSGGAGGLNIPGLDKIF